MAEFLDSFDVERTALISALAHVEEVWARFQERRALEVEGAEASDSLIASELNLVRGDLAATEFTVGIFGLIKRGKSTLLNGLIGREVSSMHVTPETAVPVYVSYGDDPEAVVHFADGTIKHVAVEDVHAFTSQKANPNNQLGVTFVEQQVPVGFLRNGTRLIDTPGLDDAEADEVYTERTLQELDVVDAGVVLFLSPPSVGATELQFLEQVVARDLKKTFLVCNMYPQHFHDTETREAVLEYVGQRIVDASRKAGRGGTVTVYPVCALEAWQARQADDIDLWKRSGADQLLRDLENELSKGAGKLVLRDAADRIEKTAEMAKAEVRVRQQLLNDPQQLEGFRRQLDANIFDLERRFNDAVSLSLTEVAPLKMRIRGLVLQPFTRAKKDLAELGSADELEAFASRFRRQLEVAGELASRQFAEGFEHLVAALELQLQERFQAVMTDLAPNMPQVRLSSNALLTTPDQVQALQRAQARTKSASRTSALVGGLAGGGGALAVAGATLLGPIGLLGGALVGWRLSSVVAGQRNLTKARSAIIDRLDEIAAELLRDVDRQVAEAVDSVRGAVERRRRLFASDLYQQFEVVQRISEDPTQLEAYRRDAERFIQAFDACALRARKAVGDLDDVKIPALSI
ncbi:dynamin family protein [Nitriliruptor alkaliphilus]|uniref:dynamin family protein n=1 Tax=Nitriliruptor alkaliphilus TaxID=427918 RepID=UPI000698880D|nr:dynamin family protein [Nitriliruptor alkaliphilus]